MLAHFQFVAGQLRGQGQDAGGLGNHFGANAVAWKYGNPQTHRLSSVT